MTDPTEEARERHNIFAPPIATMIVIAANGDSVQATILLESIIVGVLGHFFQGQPRTASETLDTITIGAMERLK